MYPHLSICILCCGNETLSLDSLLICITYISILSYTEKIYTAPIIQPISHSHTTIPKSPFKSADSSMIRLTLQASLAKSTTLGLKPHRKPPLLAHNILWLPDAHIIRLRRRCREVGGRNTLHERFLLLLDVRQVLWRRRDGRDVHHSRVAVCAFVYGLDGVYNVLHRRGAQRAIS